MNAPNAANGPALMDGIPHRPRLTRDRDSLQRFALRTGEMYRIAYTAGAPAVRRVSRSVAVFNGVSEHRRWDGELTACVDFVLPQGRLLSLLGSQLVDVRPAALNERGQWVLVAERSRGRRRRASRRLRPA